MLQKDMNEVKIAEPITSTPEAEVKLEDNAEAKAEVKQEPGFFQSVGNIFKDLFESTTSLVKNIGEKLVEQVKSGFKESIIKHLLFGAGLTLLQTGLGLFSGLLGILGKAQVPNCDTEKLKTETTDLFKQSAGTVLGCVATSTVGAIKDCLNNSTKTCSQAIKEGVEDLASASTKTTGKVATTLDDFSKKITSQTPTDLLSSINTAARSNIAPLITTALGGALLYACKEGIKESANVVYNKGANIFSSIKDSFVDMIYGRSTTAETSRGV